MSGRIYDYGVDPICDKCGSVMWTSTERNFNGAKCIKEGCKGSPIYKPFSESKPSYVKRGENGYILVGIFTEYKTKTRTRKEMELLNRKRKIQKILL